jgi:hypothetical protein
VYIHFLVALKKGNSQIEININNIEKIFQVISIFNKKRINIEITLFDGHSTKKLETLLDTTLEQIEEIANFTTIDCLVEIYRESSFPDYNLSKQFESMCYGRDSAHLKNNDNLLAFLKAILTGKALTEENLIQINTLISNENIVTSDGRLSEFGKYLQTKFKDKGIPENIEAEYQEYIKGKPEAINAKKRKLDADADTDALTSVNPKRQKLSIFSIGSEGQGF